MSTTPNAPTAREREAQIVARLEAATPGPWAWANTCEKGYGANVGAGCFGEDDPDCKRPLSGDLTDSGEYYVDQPIAGLDHQRAGADAAFIAHSRSDMEYLLAALSTAERERDAAQAALKEIRREYATWGDMRQSFAKMDAIAERALREIGCA